MMADTNHYKPMRCRQQRENDHQGCSPCFTAALYKNALVSGRCLTICNGISHRCWLIRRPTTTHLSLSLTIHQSTKRKAVQLKMPSHKRQTNTTYLFRLQVGFSSKLLDLIMALAIVVGSLEDPLLISLSLSLSPSMLYGYSSSLLRVMRELRVDAMRATPELCHAKK